MPRLQPIWWYAQVVYSPFDDNHRLLTADFVILPGYVLPWEVEEEYPSNFASPAEIAVEASSGASDYGNKFGEPVLTGFARSFGLCLPGGERREYIKPIMFSGGIGTLDGGHVKKMDPDTGE